MELEKPTADLLPAVETSQSTAPGHIVAQPQYSTTHSTTNAQTMQTVGPHPYKGPAIDSTRPHSSGDGIELEQHLLTVPLSKRQTSPSSQITGHRRSPRLLNASPTTSSSTVEQPATPHPDRSTEPLNPSSVPEQKKTSLPRKSTKKGPFSSLIPDSDLFKSLSSKIRIPSLAISRMFSIRSN